MRQGLLVAMLFLPLLGCQRSQPSPSDAAITADDLAHAHGLHWWIIEVGAVPEGKALCMAFVDREGVIESRGCPRVKPGDRVKIVLSDFSEANLRYSIVVGDRAYRSTIVNHFKPLDGPSTERMSGDVRRLGDFLMKKSSSGEVHNIDEPLEDHEIAITVDFYDESQPWEREGYEPLGLQREVSREDEERQER